jgi:2-phospho-L-lactate guanylyltransferase
MRIVVPFGAAEPKTRLSPVLDATERRKFAAVMLADVLGALTDGGYEPTVVADAPVDVSSFADPFDPASSANPGAERSLGGRPVETPVPVSVDERSLTAAVNARLPDHPGEEPTAVVMADLALATPTALDRLFDREAEVVLAPGRGGGTNAVVARAPDFNVDYHGASIRDHRRIAADATRSLATVDSFRLATDIDEPADLVEVLLHADGRSAAWLRDAGFEVAERDGRVDVHRQ